MLDRRLHMVNSQLRTGGVVDKVVLAAFLEVARQHFVAPEHESLAYLDRELPARGAQFRRLLAPMVLARMFQAATVVASDRVLDVGGGSGYGAALLASMGATVVLLESDTGAAEKAKKEFHNRASVTVVAAPLDSGADALGPFDLIVVEGAFAVHPESLIALMADRGRLVGIDSTSEPSQAAIYERNGEGLSRRALFETKTEILDGFKPRANFAF
jgi:protein-L-isoaspartate(D-aspartate) O-methyltransferase